jgi:hypothetical protein
MTIGTELEAQILRYYLPFRIMSCSRVMSCFSR